MKSDNKNTSENELSLDPTDWNEFSKQCHKSLDDLIAYQKTVRSRPVWSTLPRESKSLFKENLPRKSMPLKKVYNQVKKHILPYPTNNIHPRFWSWVGGTGTETQLLADMIISSKCLTAGFFPMGAVIVKQELAEEFIDISEKAEEFPHGFTSGGHPVGCAIALKSIDVIIKEGLLDNVKKVSPYFIKRLNEFNEYENIGETRGIGLMGALEMVKDKERKIPFDSVLSMGDKVANQSIDNGLICRPLGASIVLCPQFTIKKNEIDEIFDILRTTLKTCFKKIN